MFTAGMVYSTPVHASGKNFNDEIPVRQVRSASRAVPVRRPVQRITGVKTKLPRGTGPALPATLRGNARRHFLSVVGPVRATGINVPFYHYKRHGDGCDQRCYPQQRQTAVFFIFFKNDCIFGIFRLRSRTVHS